MIQSDSFDMTTLFWHLLFFAQRYPNAKLLVGDCSLSAKFCTLLPFLSRGRKKKKNLGKVKDELSMLWARIHNLFLRKRIIARFEAKENN